MVAAFALFLALPAFAQTFPPLTGRVVDNAHLLTPDQIAALDAKLATLEQTSTRQMVVATVPSLEGQEIEDYGYKLGRFWKLGDAKQNNGLLLLIAPNERKVRIEVGYGLEPIVTDALSGIIIQRTILPAFRNKDMGGGIVAGADALIGLLQLPPDQAKAQAANIVAGEKKRRSGGDIPFSLIFWIIVILFVVGSNIANRFRGGRRYGGSALPIMMWGAAGGWGGGGSSGGAGWGGGGGGGFSGGGGSFGGGGSSGSW